jgi:predicted amidophosphoribosyltransferase
VIRKFLSDAFRCPLCHLADVEWCDECLQSWQGKPAVWVIDGVATFSPVLYDERAQRIVLEAKEHGIVSARRFIVASIASVIMRLGIKGEIGIVPIPSTARALRKRGEDFLSLVVDEVIEEIDIRSSEVRARNVALLQVSHRVQDQSGLSGFERKHNLEGAISVKSERFENVDGNLPLIIIDDVITSGATMRAAITALKGAGRFHLIAGVSACRAYHFSTPADEVAELRLEGARSHL